MTEKLGEQAKALITSPDEELLITGDTLGYIKIWDLYAYCNAAYRKLDEKAKNDRKDEQIKKYIFLRSPWLHDVVRLILHGILTLDKRDT